MAISYPISLPTSPGIRAVTLREKTVVARTESPFSLQSSKFLHQGQRWEAEIQLPQMKPEDAEKWIAALTSLNGMWGTFYLGDPNRTSPLGTPTGTPVVNGASQTGQQLDVSGFTPSSTDNFKAGDYIQLGSGTNQRLYKILEDVDADGSGLATLEIWPRLRESPSDGETIIYTEPKGTFELAKDLDWRWQISRFSQITFSAREAI